MFYSLKDFDLLLQESFDVIRVLRLFPLSGPSGGFLSNRE